MKKALTNAKTKARLYVSTALSTGAAVELTPGQHHYLAHVMRISPGDSLLLFNGRDGEWRGTVETITKKRCDLAIIEQTRKQEDESDPPSDLWLAFAPIKKTRTDFIVEKASELGVARLLPVFTENTASKRVNVDRLQAISVEAAEQCERLDVPEIDEAQSLETLCEHWPQLVPARTLFVLVETGHKTHLREPIFNALEAFKQNAVMPPLGFLTGPEGGFSASELDGLHELPFVKLVSLGSRILRAETAVVAALACFQAMTEK